MPYRGTAVVSLVLGVLAAAPITWAARARSPPRPDVSSHRDYPSSRSRSRRSISTTSSGRRVSRRTASRRSVCVQTVRIERPRGQLHPRGQALRGERLENEAPRLSVRRYRRLQGDRGVVCVERPPRSEARRVCRFADREDCGRPGRRTATSIRPGPSIRRARIRGRVTSGGSSGATTVTSCQPGSPV